MLPHSFIITKAYYKNLFHKRQRFFFLDMTLIINHGVAENAWVE